MTQITALHPLNQHNVVLIACKLSQHTELPILPQVTVQVPFNPSSLPVTIMYNHQITIDELDKSSSSELPA